jgi:hypothetical protein
MTFQGEGRNLAQVNHPPASLRSASPLIWLSGVKQIIESLPFSKRVIFWVLYLPGHRQRRDPVATFDHSDIRGLGTG